MTESRLLGSWKLVSWQIPDADGKPFHPLGASAKGLLVYAPDGYMFAALSGASRPSFLGSDPLAPTAFEAMNAMRSYHTYCGRYRVEEDKVVHTVELCLHPNLVGTKQIRYYRFDDDRLILTTPPVTRAGITGTAELIWKKVASATN